jgi:TPR repeat protein
MFTVGMEIYGGPSVLYGPRYECEQWFLRSAKAGNWRAMLQLASFYAHGTFQRLRSEDPKPDPVKAWYWLDKAVEITGNTEIWKMFIDEDEGNFMEGFPPRPSSK